MRTLCIYMLSGMMLFSGFVHLLYANRTSWSNSIAPFLNKNKKYSGYGPDKQFPRSEKIAPTTINKISADATFDDFYAECKKLPAYNLNKDWQAVTPLTAEIFESVVDTFIANESSHLSDQRWLGEKYHSEVTKPFFQPFVQKLEVKADTIIAFHGDLHGDVHSLLEFINHLKNSGYMDQKDSFIIAKDNVRMVFLGDYVDRGWYGPEVMYTILRLKLANPDKVFLVRGNHEDLGINHQYGFIPQLQKLRSDDFQLLLGKIGQMYDLLPVVLYLGAQDVNGTKDFIQCCHGGMELGYNPQKLLQSNEKYQLLHELNAKDNFNKLDLSIQEKDAIQTQSGIPAIYFSNSTSTDFVNNACGLGHMWNDFMVQESHDDGSLVCFKNGRGLECGKKFTHALLRQHSNNSHKVRGVFRAHQHSPDPEAPMMMRITNADGKGEQDDRGCGKLWIPAEKKSLWSWVKNRFTTQETTSNLWPGIVCTFSVSPNTPYKLALRGVGEAYGLLTVNPGFENWQLTMVRL